MRKRLWAIWVWEDEYHERVSWGFASRKEALVWYADSGRNFQDDRAKGKAEILTYWAKVVR